MPNCPYCEHLTDEDFGLVECSECGKSFMADDPVAVLDPQEPGHQEPEAQESQESEVQEPETFEPKAQEPEVFESETQESEGLEALAPEPKAQELGPLDPETQATQASQAPQESQVSAPASRPTQALQLVLEGFDTSDRVQVLAEALSDARLAWDNQGEIKKLQQGRLVLQALSPLQASVLVQKLNHLPVKIKWHTMSEPDASQQGGPK